jgi:hypothetical protein
MTIQALLPLPVAFPSTVTTNLSPQPSKSTLWRYARGRPTRRDKAASQQYLTPREEKALLEYVLRMDQRGYPLPVKFLDSIAHVIKRKHMLDPV